MVLWSTVRERCLALSKDSLSLAFCACGQDLFYHWGLGAGHADHVWCFTVQQRNCLMLLEGSPLLHNCSSKVTKTKALPADSTLQSSGNNCWIKQRGKKLSVGPQSKLESQKKNKIQKNLAAKQWEKDFLIYVEQKPESSRNCPSCFHIQSIFFLAHTEWASANFLPQTFLFLTILRKYQDS